MKSVKSRRIPEELRIILEVDGQPVGVMNLDMDRLWPIINHRRKDAPKVEWLPEARFGQELRAAVNARFVKRLKSRLYQALGDEMVRAELDAEVLNLRAEAAAHSFGRSAADLNAVLAASGCTREQFMSFFWELLLTDDETPDPVQRWKKTARKARRTRTA